VTCPKGMSEKKETNPEGMIKSNLSPHIKKERMGTFYESPPFLFIMVGRVGFEPTYTCVSRSSEKLQSNFSGYYGGTLHKTIVLSVSYHS